MTKLELDDSRRLTGKGLLWDHPGAVIDAFVDGVDKSKVVGCWQHHAQNLLKQVGWGHEQVTHRVFEDGVTVALSAPMDALYAATEINEAAWQLACDELTGNSRNIDAELVDSLKKLIDEERNPQLMALLNEAESRGVPCLSDDDEFSLGYGATAEVWAIDKLPAVDSIEWDKYQKVPIALITGTNGKSTSVRLASGVVEQAGRSCGVTSTDFIRVGSNIIDRGDYSGPGGARTLLRHPDVDVALLEVARGGILRRGLPIPTVDAALVTNVAEDHLGQYGINTLRALTQTKFVVAKGLTENGTLVVNADDGESVAWAPNIDKRKCWFAIDKANPVLVDHMAQGGAVCYVDNGMMVYRSGGGDISEIVAVNDVPCTFEGAAVHNIQNALGVIGLSKSLGLADDAIREGLKGFRSDAADNPGRGNVFEYNGAKLVVDFAHNEHSMKAIATTTANMPCKHKWLLMSSAGDRSDKDITAMAEAALSMKPDALVVAELEDYLRGRELGDIPAFIYEIAKRHGVDEGRLHTESDPVAAVKYILERLEPGDLALLLVLSNRDEVVELIHVGNPGLDDKPGGSG